MAANSANDIWAVGYSLQANASQTLIERWNGTRWSIVNSPNRSAQNILNGVAATSTGDMWAIGFTSNGQNNNQQTLIEHWDGSLWSVVSSPNPGAVQNALQGIALAPHSNRAWAVGLYGNSVKGNKTLTEFYC